MTRLSSVDRKCSVLPFGLTTGLSRLSVDPAVCEAEECETDDREEKESAEVGGEWGGGKGINAGSTFATTLPTRGGRSFGGLSD